MSDRKEKYQAMSDGDYPTAGSRKHTCVIKLK